MLWLLNTCSGVTLHLGTPGKNDKGSSLQILHIKRADRYAPKTFLKSLFNCRTKQDVKGNPSSSMLKKW